MVIKGKPRGAATGLAAYLSKIGTNEIGELVELRGVAANDLRGGLQEMAAVASGTRCRNYLYHGIINSHPDEQMTPVQSGEAVDQLETALGLSGQPRAVVRHVKDGREHLHIVWSRIDSDRMKAIPQSHNYRKHEEVSRALEAAFGFRHVEGVHTGDKSLGRPVAEINSDEQQQAERTGLPVRQVKAELTAAWQATKSGHGFKRAIEETGYILAKGERRDFVILDENGTVHSPRRRIEGVRPAEIKARFADIAPATLPSVDEGRAILEAQRHDAGGSAEKEVPDQAAAQPKTLHLPEPRPDDKENQDEEGDNGDQAGGIFTRISRRFRAWISCASQFVQGWHNRLLRSFNQGWQIEPEQEKPAPRQTARPEEKSAPQPPENKKPAPDDDRKLIRKEYQPGSYTPPQKDDHERER